MKINVKLTLAFLLICLVPLIVITLYINFVTNNAITRQVLNHLESVASIQHARTHMVIDKYHERLSLASSQTQLRINLDNYIKEKNRSYQEEMNRSLFDIRSALPGFQNIDILNLDGEVLASTNEEKIGTNQANKECFVRGLVENSVDMLHLDENRNLMVHFSGPIYMEDKLIGVLMIEATPRSLISMVKDYSGLGETGETLLAKRDENGDALFITPLRFDADAVLTRKVSKEAQELPITQALLKNQQLFTDSIDYRGEQVLAATRYIEDTDWGLVVKIDKKEAFAPVADLSNSLVFVIVIASIAIILVSFYTARNITRPISSLTRRATEISGGNLSRRVKVTSKDEIGVLAKSFNQMADNLAESYAGLEQKVKQRTVELEKEVTERKQAEEMLHEKEQWLSTTLRSIGDAVIATDDKGIVSFMNHVAEDLTGWDETKAVGKSLKDVFNIINEQTGEPAENPVARVIREGIVVGLANHTVLIAKDGTKRPISDSGAPLRDEEGNIIGVVMVFRDITERKKMEVEKDRLQEQLIQSEKMAGIGTLTSGIAHEFNNLLQIMSGHAEFAQRTKKPKDMEEALDLVGNTSDRVSKIIKDLLIFSRKEAPEREVCNIIEQIESVLFLTEEQLEKHNIEVVAYSGPFRSLIPIYSGH